MEWLSSPEAWIALTTLTALEIVLGVDNIIFISILVGRLPDEQRQRARLLGLAFAMGTRILLLLLLTWIMRLQATLFTAFDIDISGRDLILIGGGLFLIAKSTLEIHTSLEGEDETRHGARRAGFISVILQIGIIDIVFSLDSVITAVGLANDVVVMIMAIVIAVVVMMFAAGAIGRFVDDHPTIKMLALSFLRKVEHAALKKKQKTSFSSNVKGLVWMTDREVLDNILRHLLGNASKFTPEGGQFGLEIFFPAAKDAVLLTVWDTGIGIQPDDYERIFQPFVQLDARLSRKYEGAGLGLALVRQYLTLLGGGVDVQSVPGEGSRFTLTLPLLMQD